MRVPAILRMRLEIVIRLIQKEFHKLISNNDYIVRRVQSLTISIDRPEDIKVIPTDIRTGCLARASFADNPETPVWLMSTSLQQRGSAKGKVGKVFPLAYKFCFGFYTKSVKITSQPLCGYLYKERMTHRKKIFSVPNYIIDLTSPSWFCSRSIW